MSEILNVRPGTPAHDFTFETIWQEDFKTDLSKWYQDPLDDNLHRAGNNYLNDDGTLAPEKWRSPKGLRWAARYDKYRDIVERITPDGLRQGIHAVHEPNPFRHSFCVVEYKHPETGSLIRDVIDEGDTAAEDFEGFRVVDRYPYGEWQFYTSWMGNGGSRIKGPNGHYINDFNLPNHNHGPGSYINQRCNFEHMKVRNARSSLWSMTNSAVGVENTKENPAPFLGDGDTNYNESMIDGVEIDIYELVHSKRRDFTILSQKTVAGSAGDSKAGTVNHEEQWNEFGIDIMHGWHDIGCAWYPSGAMDFYVDGHKTAEEPRSVQTMNYLLLSMEINSGVKHAREGKQVALPSSGPKRPRDPGLTGSSAILDVDLMDEHCTYIRDISIHKMTPRKAQVQGFTPAPKPEPVTFPGGMKVELPAAKPKPEPVTQAIDLGAPGSDAQIDPVTNPDSTAAVKEALVAGLSPEAQKIVEDIRNKSPNKPERPKKHVHATKKERDLCPICMQEMPAQIDVILEPEEDKFITPILSCTEPSPGTKMLSWTPVQPDVHGYNVQQDGEYISTVLGNSIAIGDKRGKFRVKAINKGATKVSEGSNEVIV